MKRKISSAIQILSVSFISLTSCNDSSNYFNQENTHDDVRTEQGFLEEEANKNFKEGNFEKALVLYNTLIEKDTLNGEYYFKRGSSFARNNMFENAANDYLHSARLDYRKSDSYYNIGAIKMVLFSDNDSARYYFKKALKANPLSREALVMLVSLENE